MEIDEKYLSRILKILARELAHERVGNYARRTLLIDSADVDSSIDIHNKRASLQTGARRHASAQRDHAPFRLTS